MISYHKHNTVTTQIVSRYVKQTLIAAGTNTSLFTAHSISSKTFMKGLSLTDIVKKGGRKSTSTFRKLYNLPILNNWILFSSANISFANTNAMQTLMQWRLIGIIPIFCEANWSGVISGHSCTPPNKGFQVGLWTTTESHLLHLINLAHRI